MTHFREPSLHWFRASTWSGIRTPSPDVKVSSAGLTSSPLENGTLTRTYSPRLSIPTDSRTYISFATLIPCSFAHAVPEAPTSRRTSHNNLPSTAPGGRRRNCQRSDRDLPVRIPLATADSAAG